VGAGQRLRFGVHGLINHLQAFGDFFAILPAAEVQGMAHEVRDAGLDRGVGIGSIDRVRCPAGVCLQTPRGREALEAVHNGNQDIFQPTIFEVIHDG